MTARTGRNGAVERRARRQLPPPGEATDWIPLDNEGDAQEAPSTPAEPGYSDPESAMVRFYEPPEFGTRWEPALTRRICRRLSKKYGKNREEGGSKLKATLLDWETKANSVFIRSTDGRPWIWADDKQKVLPINLKNKRFADWATMKYSLVPTEGISKTAVSDLASWTMENGELREVKRFSFWDKVNGILYLSRYDDTVYKIDGSSIEIIPNGDGVLFIDDDGGVPTEAMIPVYTNGARPTELWDALVNDLNFAPASTSGMSDVAQKTLFSIWIMALAFPDLLTSKPIMLMIGGPGAGKTSSVERIQLLVQGKSVVKSLGQNDEKDFGVTIMRESIALLDNVDTPIEWLKDALAAYCTGGSWTRRKLHTDDDLITFKPHAFIAIATKNPATFRRDDMADRSILIELQRRFGGNDEGSAPSVGGVALEVLRQRILDNRPRLYGQWLWYLNRIVYALKNPAPGDADLPVQHRMADFAKFAFVAGRALGYDTAAVEAALQAEVGARVQMSSDGDSTIDVLDRWMDLVNNVARLITGLALFTELATLAESLHLPFIKSPRSLIDRLRRPDEALAAKFVITAVEINGGRGVGRSVAYEIRRRHT